MNRDVKIPTISFGNRPKSYNRMGSRKQSNNFPNPNINMQSVSAANLNTARLYPR